MIRILDPETGANVDVAVSPLIVAAFRRQLEFDVTRAPGETFGDRMRYWLTNAIVHGLSYELKPPTEKQIVFAAAISQKLGVELPRDALQVREAIGAFIDEYKPAYYRAMGRDPAS